MVISKETFTAVSNHLQARAYTGPINIACDDSKLLSGLRLHYEPEEKKHFLVGGIEGPILVPNPDDIESVMRNPDVKKGSKVSHQLMAISPAHTHYRSVFGLVQFLCQICHRSSSLLFPFLTPCLYLSCSKFTRRSCLGC